jgi:hypothetical protein
MFSEFFKEKEDPTNMVHRYANKVTSRVQDKGFAITYRMNICSKKLEKIMMNKVLSVPRFIFSENFPHM